MQIINLIGHIGRDAETKHIGERDYISFSVACTEKRNNEESTTWYSVLYPHQEALLPFLKKGQQVYVSGRLKAGIYQNQQSFGIDLSVFAQTLQLCGGKREESTTNNQVPYGRTVVSEPGSNNVPTQQTVASDPTLGGFGNYAQENMASPFPPANDEDSGLPF